jgi:hypothetical protein
MKCIKGLNLLIGDFISFFLFNTCLQYFIIFVHGMIFIFFKKETFSYGKIYNNTFGPLILIFLNFNSPILKVVIWSQLSKVIHIDIIIKYLNICFYSFKIYIFYLTQNLIHSFYLIQILYILQVASSLRIF